MKILIKLVLIALFIGCLFRMPYGYYQFFRIAAFILFGWLAYNAYEKDKNVGIDFIIFILCVVLFNPLIKIHFSRDNWQKIDLAFAIVLGVWVIVETIVYYGDTGPVKTEDIGPRKTESLGHFPVQFYGNDFTLGTQCLFLS